MNRYRVTLTRDGSKFGILDTDEYDYCSLTGEDGERVPLQWEFKEAAEMWLNFCFRRWAAWEGDKRTARKVPLRWRPQRPMFSPFEVDMRNTALDD